MRVSTGLWAGVSLALAACGLPRERPAEPASIAAGCATAPEAADRQAQVLQGLLPRVAFAGEDAPQSLQQRMALHQVPAVSVAVLRNGEIDWSLALGTQAAGSSSAVDCTTRFQGGSLAKPMTVLAALRLQEAGRVDLDADVLSQLPLEALPPALAAAPQPISLRHLLTHTAGLTPGGYPGYVPGQPLPSDAHTVRGEPPANVPPIAIVQPPGTGLAYSGGGYTLAEIRLQQVLDQPFETLMRTWLLDPAGLRHTDFTQPPPAALEAQLARGHGADGVMVEGGWRIHPEQAAAGVWTTAADLARLLQDMVRGQRGQGRVLSSTLMQQLQAQPFEGHVYGFRLIGAGDHVFLTHYGGTAGYRAALTLNLRSGDGAVFLANGEGGQTLGQEFLQAVSRVYGWPVHQTRHVTRSSVPDATLRALAGRYRFPGDGPVIPLRYLDGSLVLAFPNGDRYALVPVEGEPLSFIHPASGIPVRFERDPERMHLYGDIGVRIGPE